MLPLEGKSKTRHLHPLQLPPHPPPVSFLPGPQQVPSTQASGCWPLLARDSPGGREGGSGMREQAPPLTSPLEQAQASPSRQHTGLVQRFGGQGNPWVCTFLAAALQEQVPGCKGHLLLGEGKGHTPVCEEKPRRSKMAARVWESAPPWARRLGVQEPSPGHRKPFPCSLQGSVLGGRVCLAGLASMPQQTFGGYSLRAGAPAWPWGSWSPNRGTGLTLRLPAFMMTDGEDRAETVIVAMTATLCYHMPGLCQEPSIISFNPHSNPMPQALLSVLLYK